jgi:hypothetical protein
MVRDVHHLVAVGGRDGLQAAGPADATARESSWTCDDACVPATNGVSVDSIFDGKIEPRPAIPVASPDAMPLSCGLTTPTAVEPRLFSR